MFEPKKTLASILLELDDMSPEEKSSDNSHWDEPFGHDDIRVELRKLIETYGASATVGEFVSPNVTEDDGDWLRDFGLGE